jgi:hypothetical protein
MTEKIENAYQYAAPGKFKNIKEALQVAASALRYLTNQCEDMETIEVPGEDGPESRSNH